MNSSSISNNAWQIPDFTQKNFFQKKNDYCVCVPVINEGKRIIKQIKEMKFLAKDVDIIICDGGSTDGSLEEDFLKENNVRTLLTKTGPGKLSAQLRMGYAFALKEGYKGIVTIDGNDKDNVEPILDFIQKLKEGYGLVQGSRFIEGGKAINTPLTRLLAVKLIHIPISSLIAGFWYTDTTNGYRGYSSEFLLDNRVQPFRDIFMTYELIAYLSVRAPRLGYKICEVPVTRAYPKNEKTPTKISFFKGNYTLMKILFDLATGAYNPKKS